jgi:tetraprenyl-beta-curcumene synthase
MIRQPTLAATPLPAPWARSAGNAAPTLPRLLDSRLSLQTGLALVRANARYWSAVAPLVREQLAHWHIRAQAVSDPHLRELALEKLDDEGFNAEVAATLATLAPRRNRRRVVKAIVALEILYDYLDGLTESPSPDSSQDGRRLFEAFTDAVSPALQRSGDYYRHHRRRDNSGYLDELVCTVRFALAGLPGIAKLADILRGVAARSSEAQLHIHAIASIGTARAERWATVQSAGTLLEWREFLAGAASSVLGAHALIVAAADHHTTYAQALRIDQAYLSISVLPTVLDSLIDYERDAANGRPGYVRLYDDRDELERRLARVTRQAVETARELPNGAHHVMTIVGIVAYYTSAPTAGSDLAVGATEATARDLQPLIGPTLAVMHMWRAAKRLRALGPAPPSMRAGLPA